MSFDQAMNIALTDAKYSYLTGRFDAIGDIIVRLVERVLDFLAGLINITFDGFGDGVNTDVVAAIFVAIAVFIVALSAILITRIIMKRKKAAPVNTVDIFDEYRKNRLSFDEVLARATYFDKEGNYKEAVRHRYIALIMLFSSKDIVRVTDSMTGAAFEREVKRNMSDNTACMNGVRNLISTYYTIFFGHKTMTAEAYEQHVAAYNGLLKEI